MNPCCIHAYPQSMVFIHFQGYIVNIKEHKQFTLINFTGTNRKLQPLFKLQKCCLKIHSPPLNPFL